MGSDFEALRSRRKLREKTVEIPLDEDLLSRIDAIERRIGREAAKDERENRTPVAPQLQKELDALRLEAEEAAETFVVRELPMPTYRAIIADNPDPEGKLRWDEDTFGPALLAACCVSHDFTAEQWKQLWDEWPAWISVPLFAAAHEVCEQPSRVPFGRRSFVGTDVSPPSSGTASSEESPTPSS